MIHPSDIDGWIIAGGKSSRMGVDKAALEIGGRRLIEIAADALSNISEGRISIAGEPREIASEWPAFPDEVRGLGPLSGLVTAFSNGSSEWIAVISCDMPFVTGEVFERLAARADPEADAIVPVQRDERQQPLCALYRRSAARPIVKDLIQGHDRSMQNLLSRMRVQNIPFTVFKDLPNPDHLFLNINSPADHERARAIFLGS